MGQGEAKLTSADVALASQIANEIPSGLATSGQVKKVMARYKTAMKKEKDKEIHSVAEFQKVLEKLHYYKQQVETWMKLVKPALANHPAIFVKILDDSFKKIAECPEYKETQATILFRAFDKDGNGSIDLKEFLSGFLIVSSGNPTEDARLRFDAYDTDGNGTLSKEEVGFMYKDMYQSGIRIGKVMVSVIFASTFAQSSALGIGRDDRKMVNFLMPRLLELVSEYLDKQTVDLMKHLDEVVEKIFALADQDKNGVLSRDEFVTYTTNPEITAALGKFTTSLVDPEINQEMTERIQEKTVFWILELSGLSDEQIDELTPSLLNEIKKKAADESEAKKEDK